MDVEGSNIYQIIGENKWIIAADGTPFNGRRYAMAETVDFKVIQRAFTWRVFV
ncbi:MAG: hypothetical protein WBI55_05475 [Eubacteriales bacterium]|jgi:hypothetical protein|nr:glycoside hydrolase family 43 protein [Clostridiales bacterium]